MSETVDVGPSSPGKPIKEALGADNGAVAEPTSKYKAIRAALELIGDVLGGTAVMRAVAPRHLPQHPYEDNDAYQNRRDGTVLLEATADALDTLVGKAFAKAPAPGDDMPDPVLDFLEDVDGGGTAFVPFAREWFKAGVRDQYAYALVDYTAPVAREDGAPRTLADDAKDGVRAVWRHVCALDMLELRQERVGNRTIVTMARFRDDALVPVFPYGEKLVERVKVITPGMWEVWEKTTKAAPGGKDKWELVDIGPYEAPEVRIVEFRVGDKPVLEGLAHLNVTHWQSTSDQRNILTVSRFPMLAASGIKGEGADSGLVVGPRKFLTTPDPQSKVYYVEPAGTAIESGERDLSHLEQQMSGYGGQFMEKAPEGPKSASEAVLDEGEAVSPLRSWVLDFKDCLERAVQFTGQWAGMGDDAAGSVLFDMEDDEAGLKDAGELTFITALRAKGDLDQKGVLEEAKRRRILPEDFDVEGTITATEDEKQKAQEAAMATGGLTGMFGKPAAAKGPPDKE